MNTERWKVMYTKKASSRSEESYDVVYVRCCAEDLLVNQHSLLKNKPAIF